MEAGQEAAPEGVRADDLEVNKPVPNQPLIKIENAWRIYGKGAARVAALDGVSFSIDRGEFVAIVGASGSGKSTLMNLLGALDRPTTGEITIGGWHLTGNSRGKFAEFRNKVVGFVFQQFQLMPRRSALKNVMLPLQFRRPRFSDEKERARKALEAVGLGDRMGHKPTQLSGGQQQRVAIARALVSEPEILLADEPTGALDSVTSKEIMALLHKLNREGLTVIIITHDPEVAQAAERIITLKDGKIISDVRAEMAA